MQSAHLRRMRQNKGFTLIEVIISIVIFSVISIALMDSVNQTTGFQKQVSRILKAKRVLTSVPQVIRKDIQMISNSVSINLVIKLLYMNYLNKYHPNYLKNNMDPTDLAYFKGNDLPLMGLIGDETEWILTSSSQSDPDRIPAVKIRYVLEDCPDSSSAPDNTKCLMRYYSQITSSSLLNELDPESTKQSVLLSGVTSIEFSYCLKDSELEECESSYQAPTPTGIHFPYNLPFAVKVNIQMNESTPPINLFIPLYISILNDNILESKSYTLEPTKISDDKPGPSSAGSPKRRASI